MMGMRAGLCGYFRPDKVHGKPQQNQAKAESAAPRVNVNLVDNDSRRAGNEQQGKHEIASGDKPRRVSSAPAQDKKTHSQQSEEAPFGINHAGEQLAVTVGR